MKKFLSLVLALVMTMSLVTISAGAKDFDDNADITYVEAVDVMSDLKIVDGDKSGNFNPTAGLTRGAAAKIICNLILGPTTAAELNADTAPYPDVAQDSTFAGYIAYCQKEGIISGYADGTFKPANPLTGYAFMKMLLGALGYDPAVEGYTGANWSINVAKQAIGIGLNDALVGEFNGSDFVTREEAMLYAFNTLKATMVDYDTTITIGDVTVAGSNEFDVANNARTETIKDDNKMQFAEKYFTKLSVKSDVDAFERPCNTWVNGKETIGTYVDYTLIVDEYTTSATGKELYDVIGKTAFNDYDFYSYVDGDEDDLYKEISKNNKDSVSETGNGALTQVFVNNDKEEVIVTVVNTYLAQAVADYNEKKDSVSFEIFGLNTTKAVSGEDFDVADIEKDDFVLVTYSKSEKAIQSIGEVEIVADTEIQKFTTSSVTVDGEKYDYSEEAYYDAAVLADWTQAGKVTNLKDTTYNLYLDAYGYVIGVDIVEKPTNYLFVTGFDTGLSNLSNKTADANAIFLDGTSAVIDVNVQDSKNLLKNGEDSSMINAWYTYTVNKNDVYTLTRVADAIDKNNDVAQYRDLTTETIDKKHISLAGAATGVYSKVYGNTESIYMLADVDAIVDKDGDSVGIIVGTDEVVTGVKNASFAIWDRPTAATEIGARYLSYGAYTLYGDDGYVIATIVVGESDTVASDLAYFLNDDVSSESYDKTTETWTWTRTAVIGGQEVELVETNDTGLSVLDGVQMDNYYEDWQYVWVTVKYDADGNVKKMEYADTVYGIDKAVELIEDEEDLVVMYSDADAAYTLKGHTLYDETNDKLGFLVAEDVKVVLKQTVKNKTTTTYDEGVDTLDAILDDLNEVDTNDVDANYYVDVVIEDGIATVVIIVDRISDGGYKGPTGSTNSNVEVEVDALLREIDVVVNDSTLADVEAAIKVALADAGYTWTEVDGSGSAWVVKAVKADAPNAAEYDFTVVVG